MFPTGRECFEISFRACCKALATLGAELVLGTSKNDRGHATGNQLQGDIQARFGNDEFDD